MKTLISLFIVASSLTSYAQFTIKESKVIGDYEMESTFPLIGSPENPKAAERINIMLHHVMLEKVFKQTDDNRFSEVFPPEGEYWGASEFDYEVIANNEKFFCLEISCVYTGAYSEYYSSYFVFDAQSGQRIILKDIFSETVLTDLSDWVNESIIGQIDEFLIDIDTTEEYGYEQYWMYTDCKDWMNGELYETSFLMTDTTIVFLKGRCSSHAMAALDDLWDFQEEYDLEEVASLMNDNGAALMDGKPLKFGGDGVVVNKVLEGTVGGKYPITAILSHSYDTYYSGAYWYNNVKKQIHLSGEVNQMAMLQMTESVDDTETGQMELMIMTDGTLDGSWSDTTGDKNFTFDLKVGN